MASKDPGAARDNATLAALTRHYGPDDPRTLQLQDRVTRRAVDDPAELAKAARIIRAALARQAISLDELTGPAGAADG